jgi:Protein of unknown function (DUF2380)
MSLRLAANLTKLIRIKTNRALAAVGAAGVLLLGFAFLPALAADADKSPPVRIAVFDFELEDVSAGASQPGEAAADSARLKDVTSEARRVLAQSGRYSLIDVSKVTAGPVMEKSLRNCDGCDAAIALQLGADQSFVGVLRRVSRTEYAVLFRISDARTGKVLNEQEAAFLGGDYGWASGVASLLKHRVLASEN